MEEKISNHHELISIGQVWHRSWRIFSSYFIKFIIITVIPILIFNIIYWLGMGSTIISLENLINPAEFFSFSNSLIYFLLLIILVASFINIIGAIALFVLADHYNDYSVWMVFKKSVDYFWSFVLMSILIGIVEFIGIIAGYLMVTALAAIIGLISQPVMHLIFDSLLIIPFLVTSVLSIFMVFSPYMLVLKGESAWHSVKKSFILVKGHFWPIVIRLITAYIVVSILFITLGLIPLIGVTLGALICLPFLIIYTMVLFNNIYTLKKVE